MNTEHDWDSNVDCAPVEGPCLMVTSGEVEIALSKMPTDKGGDHEIDEGFVEIKC